MSDDETLWTENTIGRDPPPGYTGARASLVVGEPAVLMHQGLPDWIRDPVTDARVRVEGREPYRAEVCASCQKPISGVTMLVAARDGHPDRQLLVYECPLEHKYVFADRPRAVPEPVAPPAEEVPTP